jgi:hypothetical protein
MATTNLPSVAGKKSLDEMIDAVENMRKEVEYVFDNLDGDNFVAGTLNMWNKDIVNANSLQIADPGVSEGIIWLNGNGWKIHESPDAGGNAKGNLQFFLNNTRKATISTSGQLQLLGDASLIKLIGTTNPFIEFFIDTTRSGWVGYGSPASPTLLYLRNEQGDILINPKTTANDVSINGKVKAANLAAGSTLITPVANTTTTKSITFGKTFDSPPVMNVSANTGGAFTYVKMVSYSNVTTTGCDITIYRIDTTPTTVSWMAYDPS